jgi:hypothetical protein
MKNFLLAVALAVTVRSIALAAEPIIPKQFQGGWCDLRKDYRSFSLGDPQRYQRSLVTKCLADSYLLISDNTKQKFDSLCKALTVEQKGKETLITFRCSNTPDTGQYWKPDLLFSLSGKTLIIRDAE